MSDKADGFMRRQGWSELSTPYWDAICRSVQAYADKCVKEERGRIVKKLNQYAQQIDKKYQWGIGIEHGIKEAIDVVNNENK